jgi:hypothetical protein
MSLRYYVYVSKSKVDLLFEQIPEKALGRIATKLTIDLKLIKAEFSEKESQRSLYSKLEIVEQYLDESELIGTVDDPRAYFRGVTPMRWGPYGETIEREFVYFGGWTDKTLLGLGGSSKHVIGNEGVSHAHSHSATPYLVDALRREFATGDMGADESIAASCVYYATPQMKGPFQTLEFLAKRLGSGGAPGVHFYNDPDLAPRYDMTSLLGTPLFVSLTE